MRNRLLFVLPIALGCLPGGLYGQQSWTNILDPSRAINWSNAGVIGGIPARTTQCGTTIAAYGTSSAPASAATINTAIASCAAGSYVSLGAGTFYLSSGVDFGGHNNVTVRGQGANQTFLNFSLATYPTTYCDGIVGLVCMAGSNSSANGEQNVCDWTAGYAQSATTITLANCGSTAPGVGAIGNLYIGSLIILDQVDQTNDNGTIWNCSTQNACVDEGGGGYSRTDGPTVGGTAYRTQQQIVQVTNCTNTGGVCTSGANITITPGLYMSNWTATQLPQAWFASTYITGDGIENLSLDTGGIYVADRNITILNCYQCWVKGVRSTYAERSHVVLEGASHCTVQDSYFYQNINHGSQSYGIENSIGSDNLVQNNIVQQVTDSSPSTTGGNEGSVFAYNFSVDTQFAGINWFQGSYYLHAGGDAMNLWEGNIGTGFNADNIHGTHHFETLFRNYFPGWQSNCDGGTCTAQTVAINFGGGSRYFNVVGNVFGTPGYHTQYQCAATSSASCTKAAQSIYSLGFTNNIGVNDTAITGYCTSPSCASKGDYDPQTVNYLMRWGNYDVVSNTVRWCGKSTDSGWAATCGSTSEVPTSLASFSTAVPSYGDTGAGQTIMQPSFYLSTKPSWFGSIPFPAAGPEVTAGTLGVCSGGTYSGLPALTSAQCSGGTLVASFAGHANANPAMTCALNTMLMPTDGSGPALPFNAANCYNSSTGSGPVGVTQLSPPSITVN
jgi:hypothetical protein